MFRLPETFALPPTHLRDFRPLIPPSSYASPLLCAPHHALARRATERSEEARQPSACRLPIRARPIPTHWFHVKHERTDRSMRMVFDMRPGWLAALAFVLAALVLRRRRLWHRAAAMRIGTRSFHVKPMSVVRSRSRAPCSCRARAESGVRQYDFLLSPPAPAQLKMRRRTHSPTAPSS